jgi:hypothetical protein
MSHKFPGKIQNSMLKRAAQESDLGFAANLVATGSATVFLDGVCDSSHLAAIAN